MSLPNLTHCACGLVYDFERFNIRTLQDCPRCSAKDWSFAIASRGIPEPLNEVKKKNRNKTHLLHYGATWAVRCGRMGKDLNRTDDKKQVTCGWCRI